MLICPIKKIRFFVIALDVRMFECLLTFICDGAGEVDVEAYAFGQKHLALSLSKRLWDGSVWFVGCKQPVL